jgi:hypothetical protein
MAPVVAGSAERSAAPERIARRETMDMKDNKD